MVVIACLAGGDMAEESSSEGQQSWEMNLEGITYEAAMQENAAQGWQRHEQHETAVRAIAQRHAEARQREQSRPRSRSRSRVCSTGQRHTYHSVLSVRRSGEFPGHGRGEGKGFWATLREWFPVFFGG